jgi:hypothetical protein
MERHRTTDVREVIFRGYFLSRVMGIFPYDSQLKFSLRRVPLSAFFVVVFISTGVANLIRLYEDESLFKTLELVRVMRLFAILNLLFNCPVYAFCLIRGKLDRIREALEDQDAVLRGAGIRTLYSYRFSGRNTLCSFLCITLITSLHPFTSSRSYTYIMFYVLGNLFLNAVKTQHAVLLSVVRSCLTNLCKTLNKRKSQTYFQNLTLTTLISVYAQLCKICAKTNRLYGLCLLTICSYHSVAILCLMYFTLLPIFVPVDYLSFIGWTLFNAYEVFYLIHPCITTTDKVRNLF